MRKTHLLSGTVLILVACAASSQSRNSFSVDDLPSGNGGFICPTPDKEDCIANQRFRRASYVELEEDVESIQIEDKGPTVAAGAALYLPTRDLRQMLQDELERMFGQRVQLDEIKAVQLVEPNSDGTFGFRQSHKVNVSRDRRDMLGLGKLAQMAFGSKYETRQDAVFKPEKEMLSVDYDSDWAIVPIPRDLPPGTYTLLLVPTQLYYSFTVEAKND